MTGMDFQSKKRRNLLALLLSISATTCSAPKDDTADATTDPLNVVAAAPPTAAAQTQCEWESGFRISLDSIGPLVTTDPVGVMMELCPQARSRLAPRGLPGLRAGDGGIVIPVPGGEVYGVQRYGLRRRGEVLHLGYQVDIWLVTGDGTLPEGMSMKSTFGDLRRAYGPGCTGFSEPEWNGLPGYVAVRFDRQIGLTFHLENLDASELDHPNPFEHYFDLSSMPDSATILNVYASTGTRGMSSEVWCD